MRRKERRPYVRPTERQIAFSGGVVVYEFKLLADIR
jgi:hypothetical protein